MKKRRCWLPRLGELAEELAEDITITVLEKFHSDDDSNKDIIARIEITNDIVCDCEYVLIRKTQLKMLGNKIVIEPKKSSEGATTIRQEM